MQKKTNRIVLSAVAVVSMCAVFDGAENRCLANGMSDLMESQTEMTAPKSSQGILNQSFTSAPTAELQATEKSRFSISNLAMFLGPAVNNFNGHLTQVSSGGSSSTATAGNRSSSGGGHSGRHQRDQSDSTAQGVAQTTGTVPSNFSPGSSWRDMINVGYRLDDYHSIGPVVGFSQKLYGNHQNVQFDDPQVRYSINDVVDTRFFSNPLHANVWLSASAPVSDESRKSNTITALGASFIPRMNLAGTHFTLSSTSSVRMTLIDKNGGGQGILTPFHFFGGIQTAYRISHPLTAYVMTYASASAGPAIATQDDDPVMEATRAGQLGNKVGLMPGMMIRPANWVSLSPRLNWQFGQPLNTTTVGLNANVTML